MIHLDAIRFKGKCSVILWRNRGYGASSKLRGLHKSKLGFLDIHRGGLEVYEPRYKRCLSYPAS